MRSEPFLELLSELSIPYLLSSTGTSCFLQMMRSLKEKRKTGTPITTRVRTQNRIKVVKGPPTRTMMEIVTIIMRTEVKTEIEMMFASLYKLLNFLVENAKNTPKIKRIPLRVRSTLKKPRGVRTHLVWQRCAPIDRSDSGGSVHGSPYCEKNQLWEEQHYEHASKLSVADGLCHFFGLGEELPDSKALCDHRAKHKQEKDVEEPDMQSAFGRRGFAKETD